ncbi:uncharacterized protein A1O5_07755 [Cladophialophora psammophila CBS 110553]|uniref:C4-dicarboxylate transporter/malic acid transporter n=1 Tax=Cladophialophora psammophila CBS 110553 TaxID=1182543 RepID=W9XEG2_9EURO|nr:uncharacterized protein A1O5_07755 [Cladophialophora psammophila CBS 110553]EXJ68824.1 hypothetical protein A1O5_07755 [Cladophialophora psammophila CBS 110553]
MSPSPRLSRPSSVAIPPTQPYGSMMPRARPINQRYHGDYDTYPGAAEARSPYAQDGWRTPIVEDPEHRANRSRNYFNNVSPPETSSEPPWKDSQTTAAANGEDAEKGKAEGMLDDHPKVLSWSQRMKHVTWAWFTLTMATGGIANVLHAVPYRFHGLYAIGVAIFLLNIVLYIVIWAMIITRFTLYPWTFRASFTHPTESLFVPAFAVSFGTILINIVQYGSGYVGLWLNRTVLILYWFDCGLAIVLSIIIYLVLWSTQTFTIARMTPIWIFPAYPLLIIGPHAANIATKALSSKQAIRILVGGFTIQGIGFLVSLTIYSAFVYRLMTQKLPAEPLRPGMFVSVGPSAFTVSGTIGMANDLHRVIASSPTSTFMDVPGVLAAQILKLVATWMCLWLWGLAWWFFFVSLVSNVDCLREKHRMPFAMTWFSFIFPQTALTTATFAVAEAFDVDAIRVIGCVMTALLIIVWFVVVGFMIRAIVNKQILWPERGEDKSEGGFKARMEDSDTSVTTLLNKEIPPMLNDGGTRIADENRDGE